MGDWLRVGDGFLPLHLNGIPVMLCLDEGARVCPKNHGLARFLVKKDGAYFCNVCRGHPARGSVMFGCQLCDFDLCGKCAVREAKRGQRTLSSSDVAKPPGPERQVCQDWFPLVFTCA